MGNNTPCVLLMDACGQRNCACVKVKFALCDCISHARKVQLLDNCIPGPPNVYVRVTRPFRFFSGEAGPRDYKFRAEGRDYLVVIFVFKKCCRSYAKPLHLSHHPMKVAPSLLHCVAITKLHHQLSVKFVEHNSAKVPGRIRALTGIPSSKLAAVQGEIPPVITPTANSNRTVVCPCS